MNKVLFLLFLFILITGTVVGDDQPAITEFLKWLPDSNYSEIHFYNFSVIEGHDLFDLYKETHGNKYNAGIKASHLPESFQKARKAYCNAVFSSNEIYKKKGKVKLANSGDQVSIVYLENGMALLEESLRKKIIVPAGFRLHENPVFLVPSVSGMRREDGFLWLASDSTAILASSEEALKLVAKTGLGGDPSFIDNSENTRIVNLASGMGPEWHLRFVASVKQKLIDILVAEGKEFDKVDTIEEGMEETMLFEFNEVAFSKDIIKRRYMVYSDAGTAEEVEKLFQKTIKEVGAGFKKDLKKSQSKKPEPANTALDRKYNAAKNNYAVLTITELVDKFENQKITRERDTVIVEDFYSEKQFQKRLEKEKAKVEMDKLAVKVEEKNKKKGDNQ